MLIVSHRRLSRLSSFYWLLGGSIKLLSGSIKLLSGFTRQLEDTRQAIRCWFNLHLLSLTRDLGLVFGLPVLEDRLSWGRDSCSAFNEWVKRYPFLTKGALSLVQIICLFCGVEGIGSSWNIWEGTLVGTPLVQPIRQDLGLCMVEPRKCLSLWGPLSKIVGSQGSLKTCFRQRLRLLRTTGRLRLHLASQHHRLRPRRFAPGEKSSLHPSLKCRQVSVLCSNPRFACLVLYKWFKRMSLLFRWNPRTT